MGIGVQGVVEGGDEGLEGGGDVVVRIWWLWCCRWWRRVMMGCCDCLERWRSGCRMWD